MTDAEIEASLALEHAGARIAALLQLHPNTSRCTPLDRGPADIPALHGRPGLGLGAKYEAAFTTTGILARLQIVMTFRFDAQIWQQ
jgi:hypothetical protein